MANEYIALRTSEYLPGELALSTIVIEQITKIAVSEVENVELVERTTLRTPILCKVVDNNLILQINLKIKYNSNINDVCLNVQNRVNKALLQMTALRCKDIDIKIVGFII